MTATRQPTLFRGLIDYAGVFPPAAHSLEEATTRYREAVTGLDGWLLGPMLIRASQLAGFSDGEIPLGIIADAPLGSEKRDFSQVEQRVDPADASAAIRRLVDLAPVIYVESTDPDDLTFLNAIAAARAVGHDVRAKIRTGGASAAAFPTPTSAARFLTACVDRDIPFKATAGLHHPVRTDSDVAGAVEHGFINMLAAVRCALGGRADVVEACLAETDPSAFEFPTATWRDIGSEVPDERIREIFRSIGSCSFDEPAGYLRDLGLIE